MSSWNVDPAGVIEVLAEIDAAGESFPALAREWAEVVDGGAEAMSADGRRVLSDAFAMFASERADVLELLLAVVSTSATAVSNATVAVVSGDHAISENLGSAYQQAADWGIPSFAGTPYVY